jgi:sporulation protein YlmC with PRC-barrel domain
MRFVGTALVAGTIGVFFLLADGGWIRAGTGTAGTAGQDNAPRRKNNKFVRGERFKQFIGTTVENVDGEKLGTIKDLVLQPRSGQIRYVIVKVGGVFHRRRVIVPTFAIAMTTAKVGTASVDVSARRWRRAPEFRKQDLAVLADPEQAQAIAHFYDKGGGPFSLAQNSEMRARLSGRKSDSSPQTGESELDVASDIIGKEVVSLEHEQFGEVEDLLINFSEQKPALALLRVREGDSFAVPIHLLGPAQNGKLRINAERESFERAQLFSFENWKALETGRDEIYRWGRR